MGFNIKYLSIEPRSGFVFMIYFMPRVTPTAIHIQVRSDLKKRLLRFNDLISNARKLTYH
jgi:hypothetical protein